MIGIFDDSGARLPIIFNTTLRLNEPIDGNPLHIFEVNAVNVRDIFSGLNEPKPVADGSESYASRKTAKIVRIDGITRAPTYSELYDMQAELTSELDPARLSEIDQITHGFARLTFTTPSVLFAQVSYVLARPVSNPDFMFDQYIGKNIPFRIEMLCANPRRYLQSTGMFTLTGTDTDEGTNLGNYQSDPSISITMSGAGNADFQLKNTTQTPDGLVSLNLSGCISGDVIDIFIDDKKVTKNGARLDSIVNNSTDWRLHMLSGVNTMQTLNGTNTATTITTRHAYSM